MFFLLGAIFQTFSSIFTIMLGRFGVTMFLAKARRASAKKPFRDPSLVLPRLSHFLKHKFACEEKLIVVGWIRRKPLAPVKLFLAILAYGAQETRRKLRALLAKRL